MATSKYIKLKKLKKFITLIEWKIKIIIED